MASRTVHVVLVHGLWHGGWCWAPVASRLGAAGLAHTAVDLPMRTLADDVAVVTARLDELAATGADVLLVGHSYGGAVITEAGAHPAVRALLYLAAFQLDTGESVSRVRPELPPSEMDAVMRTFVRDGEVVPDAEVARPLLYADAPAELADAALARMVPVSTALFRAVPAAIAWRDRPSTYVVCTEDRVVHPQRQRAMAGRATRSLEWPSDHSPQAGRPDDVAALIAELAGGLSGP